MDGLLKYRGSGRAHVSLFEPKSVDLEALAADWDCKELEDGHKARYSLSTPPPCREIQQSCPLHAIPTNITWILLDDSTEDLNQYLLLTTDGTSPAPGLFHFDSYPAGFCTTSEFVQVEYRNLSPRCVHGRLHPSALEYCIECFPDGRHFNCAEYEAHPLFQKPAGQDFRLLEHRKIKACKLRLDHHSFYYNNHARAKLE